MCKFCPFDDQERLMYGAFVTGLHWLQISISLAIGMKCKFTSRVGKRSLYYNILRVSDKLFCAIVMWNVVFYCCHLTLRVFHSPQVLTFHPSLFPPNRPWVCNILCFCLLLLCCVISKSRKGQNLHQGWAHTQRAHSSHCAVQLLPVDVGLMCGTLTLLCRVMPWRATGEHPARSEFTFQEPVRWQRRSD